MDGLGEFDKRSRHFLVGDQFINSHNLISGQSMDMVRRKLMLVTIGTERVKRSQQKIQVTLQSANYILVHNRILVNQQTRLGKETVLTQRKR